MKETKFQEIIKVLENALSKMITEDRVEIKLENLEKDDLEYIIYKLQSQ